MYDFSAFERYRPLIPDWDAFTNTLRRPHPTCIWTNTLRTSPRRLEAWMRAAAIEMEPLPWHPGAYRLAHDGNPGTQVAYVGGLCHIQEEVSLLPVDVLDPQPGERVLDLCAAPGNKTVHMAVRMNDTGTIVANDRSRQRLNVLHASLARLGIAGVVTTTHDASSFPSTDRFDRVLADVPCSCEGTSRKHPKILRRIERPSFARPTGVQEAILRKAVQLCKPGGRVVYATCTYAPEENEAIVDAVLRQVGEQALRVLPAHVEGFTASPGLTEWDGHAFHPSLARCMRVWPHQNDSGGFFVALLEKRVTA